MEEVAANFSSLLGVEQVSPGRVAATKERERCMREGGELCFKTHLPPCREQGHAARKGERECA